LIRHTFIFGSTVASVFTEDNDRDGALEIAIDDLIELEGRKEAALNAQFKKNSPILSKYFQLNTMHPKKDAPK